MIKQFIAYQGKKLTIEWYYDIRGYSQALDYFDGLPSERKRKILNLFKIMANDGKIVNETKFKHEGDKIFAFKARPDRLLCFFCRGKRIVVTNGFAKKGQKLLRMEKERALNAYNS